VAALGQIPDRRVERYLAAHQELAD
jgi:hypothetical protein